MQLYMSSIVLIHHIIFWLYLYILNILFFKYSCTNIFHRRSLCTFYRRIKNDLIIIFTKRAPCSILSILSQIVEHTEIDEHLEKNTENLMVEHKFYT